MVAMAQSDEQLQLEIEITHGVSHAARTGVISDTARHIILQALFPPHRGDKRSSKTSSVDFMHDAPENRWHAANDEDEDIY